MNIPSAHHCLVGLLIFDIFTSVAAAACDGGTLLSERLSVPLSQSIEMYRNVSTAPSLVKIKVNDARNKKILNMILDNNKLAGFMANERRIPKGDLARFYQCEYVELMLQNHDHPLELDVERFEDYLAKTTFGSKSIAKKYLREAIFESPMTLQELQVKSEEELIEKYFFFDGSNNIGNPKSEFAVVYNPRFTALLIDLGYVVSRGDIVPILRIRKFK